LQGTWFQPLSLYLRLYSEMWFQAFAFKFNLFNLYRYNEDSPYSSVGVARAGAGGGGGGGGGGAGGSIDGSLGGGSFGGGTPRSLLGGLSGLTRRTSTAATNASDRSGGGGSGRSRLRQRRRTPTATAATPLQPARPAPVLVWAETKILPEKAVGFELQAQRDCLAIALGGAVHV
jgi:hypothetical protein